MDCLIWVVLSGAVGVALGYVWWKRRARRVYVIDHVRVEMHPACVVEDRAIEVAWRAAISMTNTSRKPRTLPVFAERATVRAGRQVYLATVCLDIDVHEVNPSDVALAWVDFVLPAPEPSRLADVGVVRGKVRTLRFVCLPGSLPRASRFVELV